MNDDTKPSSKVTAATVAALLMAIVATVSEVTGIGFDIPAEVYLWAASVLVGLFGYFTNEDRPSASARKKIESQQKK